MVCWDTSSSAVVYRHSLCCVTSSLPSKAHFSSLRVPLKLSGQLVVCRANTYESGTGRSVTTVPSSLLVAEWEEARAVLSLFLRKQGLSYAVAARIINKSDQFIDHLISKLHTIHKSRYLATMPAQPQQMGTMPAQATMPAQPQQMGTMPAQATMPAQPPQPQQMGTMPAQATMPAQPQQMGISPFNGTFPNFTGHGSMPFGAYPSEQSPMHSTSFRTTQQSMPFFELMQQLPYMQQFSGPMPRQSPHNFEENHHHEGME